MATNGINRITDKILADAQARANGILADAQAECDRINADYDARVQEIRDKLSEDAQAKGADMIARAKAAAAMKKRNILQAQESQLIDGVFDGAKEWVLGLPKEKYTDLLAGLLSAALIEQADTEAQNLATYGEESEPIEQFEVLMNKRDRESCGKDVLENVKKRYANSSRLPAGRIEKLVLSKNTLNIDGGVVLRYGDVESNCSLEMLFGQLHRELEAEVAQALFDVRTTI